MKLDGTQAEQEAREKRASGPRQHTRNCCERKHERDVLADVIAGGGRQKPNASRCVREPVPGPQPNKHREGKQDQDAPDRNRGFEWQLCQRPQEHCIKWRLDENEIIRMAAYGAFLSRKNSFGRVGQGSAGEPGAAVERGEVRGALAEQLRLVVEPPTPKCNSCHRYQEQKRTAKRHESEAGNHASYYPRGTLGENAADGYPSRDHSRRRIRRFVRGTRAAQGRG